jgi:hypothetical protein
VDQGAKLKEVKRRTAHSVFGIWNLHGLGIRILEPTSVRGEILNMVMRTSSSLLPFLHPMPTAVQPFPLNALSFVVSSLARDRLPPQSSSSDNEGPGWLDARS